MLDQGEVRSSDRSKKEEDRRGGGAQLSGDQTMSEPGKQSIRRPGKQKTGWVKIGLYLAPEAARRLEFTTISKGVDRSEIVTNLLLAQLPHYFLTARVASKVSEISDGPLNPIGTGVG
jgi:hypothetical protein